MNFRSPLMRCALLLGLAALLLAGCQEDRLFWSPDGTRAAIINQDGLHLCDADGKLTPLLVPGAYRAAWLGDSQRLVIARSRSIKDYATLAATLGPERTKALVAKAEATWQLFLASPESSFGPDDGDLLAIVVYLREHHGAALREKLAQADKDAREKAKANPPAPKDPRAIDLNPDRDQKEQDSVAEMEAMTAAWHSLVVARVNGDRLELGATLSEGLAMIFDVRPAPDGSAVAFITHPVLSPTPVDALHLYLAPIDGSAPATLVASNTAAHPDWTPDSRTLVYLKAAGGPPGGDLRLGALVERDVRDAAGHIQLAEKTRDLAGLIFGNDNRVRCLRDGRVLFDAAEFHLPLAGSDHNTREQLFAIDRTKDGAALTPMIRRDQLADLSNALAGFAVSPDEQQVLLDAGADQIVLTLASGTVERLALKNFNGGQNSRPPFPVWRRAGEIVYVKSGDPRDELVLRRGTEEIVLSRTWSDELLEKLIK